MTTALSLERHECVCRHDHASHYPFTSSDEAAAKSVGRQVPNDCLCHGCGCKKYVRKVVSR